MEKWAPNSWSLYIGERFGQTSVLNFISLFPEEAAQNLLAHHWGWQTKPICLFQSFPHSHKSWMTLIYRKQLKRQNLQDTPWNLLNHKSEKLPLNFGTNTTPLKSSVVWIRRIWYCWIPWKIVQMEGCFGFKMDQLIKCCMSPQ